MALLDTYWDIAKEFEDMNHTQSNLQSIDVHIKLAMLHQMEHQTKILQRVADSLDEIATKVLGGK